MKRDRDIALICNPGAGGRWRELAPILDSAEARHVRRIVTDEINDIEQALSDLGRRVHLLCIYGGDGTIQKIVSELLRKKDTPAGALAFVGGGTMNLASRWLGWGASPTDNFREVVQRALADRQLYTEAPVLEIRQGDHVTYGFTFGMGPIVRILDRYEHGRKGKVAALDTVVRSLTAAWTKWPPEFASILDNMRAEVLFDGDKLPYESWVALFANVTGILHLGVRPFGHPRTRESFHALAYASTARELVVLLPFLSYAKLPIDPAVLLRPASAGTQLALSYFGKSTLPHDPRYINRPTSVLKITSEERLYTVDGELFESTGEPIEIKLGPPVRMVAGPGKPMPQVARRSGG